MTKKLKAIEDIFTTSSKRSYKKGQVIFHQDDELVQVGYIKEGFVKLYTISNDGEERVLLLFGPGMPIPFSLSFPKGYKIRYFYEAFTNVEICMSPREVIADKLKASRQAKLLMAQKLEELMIDLSDRLVAFESKNAKDKIANLLPYLTKVCGEPITKNIYAIKFKITHQDIANMTGLARETASIQLKELEKSGILTQKRSFTVIDLTKLPAD